MPYATVSDMIERYGERELINVTTPAGEDRTSIGVDRVNQALASASDRIDSYLNRRYAVPLSSPSQSIIDACCRIARCDLNQSGEGIPTDAMLSDRKDSISWLMMLADGRISLDGALPANTTQNFSRITRRMPGQSGAHLW